MSQQAPEKFFNQQTAVSYDTQWAKTAPIRDALHLHLAAILANLPEEANILCVGAGTGAELLFLAQTFPGWRFAVVEPSAPMLEVCRRKAQEQGIVSRCIFHEGYVDSLEAEAPFDAATALLVSQFILDEEARTGFFRAIARRLRPGGYLVSSDLCADIESPEYLSLLKVWLRMTQGMDPTPERIEQVCATYRRDVAVWTQERVAGLIEAGGFAPPIEFYQAGLIHAWFTQRVDTP